LRLASVLVGFLLGLGAILLAWSRTPRGPKATTAASRSAPQAGTQRWVAPPVGADDLAWLRRRALAIPVAGLGPEDLRDTFADAREGRRHEAIDLLAPRGTRVIAADDGIVVRLLTSSRGGRSVYQLDPSSTYCYLYAHLDRYVLRLREGLVLRKGETLGYVGSSGNASWRTPHLHFAVVKMGPEKAWGRGTALNPFALWVARSDAEPAARLPSR
jgi:murein DD-endopeptidase MepM/ murein hydrolase activator NlpD